jgi:hypothetical protein
VPAEDPTVARPAFRIAAVFDLADPVTGPGFAADHPRIDDPAARGRLVRYLVSAPLVLTTLAAMSDVIDPARGAVVPMDYRTDGTWIWTDTVTYYLKEHALAPADTRFHQHIRNASLPVVVSADRVRAAATFLVSPPRQSPVWTRG